MKVKQTFYHLVVLQQKRHLLQEADSIYAGLAQKMQQRFRAGDVDILENTTAQNQRQQIANQLQALATDYQLLQNHLRVLLNSRTAFEPVADSAIYSLSLLPDTALVKQHPALLGQRQQIQLAEQQQQLEKSKLLPSLMAGYNSATIVGWQVVDVNTEKYFGHGKRFSSVMIGVGVPLFSSAQRSRIQAAQVLVRQRREEAQAVDQGLRAGLQNALRLYEHNAQLLHVYLSSMLPNAATILKTASGKLAAGEINYLDWVVLVNQAIQIRSDYFGVVQQQNEAAFEIEKITSIH